MPEETIQISAEVMGPQGSVLERVTKKLTDELAQRSGLTPAEVAVQDRFRVSLHAKKGKDNFTGESAVSFEDAVTKAAAGKPYHDNTVSLTVTREVLAPYFATTVMAVGVGKEACLADLTRQVEALQTRYGSRRVVETPQSVAYEVLRTSYASGSVPLADLVDAEKRDANRILSSGQSNVSMEAAEAAAAAKKDTTGVYLARHNLKVYGPEAYQLPAEVAAAGEGEGVLARAGRAVRNVAGKAAAVVGGVAAAGAVAARSAPRAYSGGGGGASPTNALDASTDYM